MGAVMHTVRFELMPVDELEREFAVFQHAACMDNGSHDTAGHLGIKRGLQVYNDNAHRFDNLNDAETFIEEHSDKDDPAIAVQTIANIEVTFPVTAKDRELKDRFKKVCKKIDDFPAAVTTRAKNMKAKLYTCKHCGSKISTSHIKDIYCPVCSNPFLYTDTDCNRVKTWIDKREKLRGQIFARTVEIKQKYANDHKRGYVWVVGGWCRE